MVYGIIAALVFIADRLTKYFIMHNVSVGDTFGSFLGIFDFTYVQNQGAAWSMLSGKTQLLSLVSFAFCAAVMVIWIIKKPKNRMLSLALTLMFSGALGNAVDRAMYGYVVDFIETTFVDFPIFNIADMGITIGAVILVIYILFFDKDKG